MVKLKIVNIDNYVYDLKNSEDKTYQINLEFLDMEKKPQAGDYIYMHNELLNPRYAGYSISYTFGNLENPYGKKDVHLGDIDVITVIIDEKEIFLKRLYG